jgi:importin-7
VSSVESVPEILAQVQEVIVPIIMYSLEHKIIGTMCLVSNSGYHSTSLTDLFDNMYDLVDSLTFKLRSISSSMWPVFELTYKLFKADAVDFLEGKLLACSGLGNTEELSHSEMLPSLDNFVSFGTDAFKNRADYRQMVLDIYTTCMASDQLGENDRVNGCKLAESILLNLRGHVDDVCVMHLV